MDWTVGEDGRANTSAKFKELQIVIGRLIRGSAHDLIAGRAESVAGLILAQLAHKHRMSPAGCSVCNGSGYETIQADGGVVAYVACQTCFPKTEEN